MSSKNNFFVKIRDYYNSKNPLVLFGSILCFFVLFIGGTYAYLFLSTSSENTVTGTGGCFVVDYVGQVINAGNLNTTTNYLEGAKTTVTLSKNENCDIYTLGNIYVYSDPDVTTFPIVETPALKYTIIDEDGLVYEEGLITDVGDVLLTEVDLYEEPTSYDIHLWVDSELSRGTYNNTSFSGYIYATSDQSSTITE